MSKTNEQKKEKEKNSNIMWGSIPTSIKLNFLSLGAVLIIFVYAFLGLVAGIISAGVILVLFLCTFLHFSVTKQGNFTVWYGPIKLSIKNESYVVHATDLGERKIVTYTGFESNKRIIFFMKKEPVLLKDQPQTTKEEIDEKISKLTKRYKKQSIHFQLAKTNSKSQFGGIALLPKDFAWPRFNRYGAYMFNKIDKPHLNAPLSFIADFDLSEVAPFDDKNLLPDSGHLCVFYDLKEKPYGQGKENPSLQIFYFPEDIERVPTVPPEKDVPVLEKQGLTFYTKTELPSKDEMEARKLINGREVEAYYEILDCGYKNPEHEYTSKIFGYEDSIQGFTQNSCPTRHILLFQFDSFGNDDEFMLHDGGKIYVYITPSDLKKLDFSRITYELQCG